MILVLLAVCLLAYVLLRLGVRRFQRGGPATGQGLRVIARLGLEPRRTLYVVQVGERALVVGAGESGLSLLCELDPETARALQGPAAPRPSFRDFLARKKD